MITQHTATQHTATGARAPLSFTHRYVPATNPATRPLLLLHGTGGDENDLLPLGRMMAPGAALLSPRGQVSEAGMPRFFRRLAEGVFDEADVARRAGELADFIAAARAAYGLAAPIAVGFSNGANIAAAVLMLRPEALAGAVLLRAMVPLSQPPHGALPATPVLMLSGRMDPIVPQDNAQRLAGLLAERGARVEHRHLSAGHGLTPTDMTAAQEWLAAQAVVPAA
ncbi:alpha/beta hydrolase [Xanthobacter sp. AM11]|uniref:alpha/beta hydrolase n=1 Tax=Xanthobacter sp. AM11 TaxID=3380643 RepID=UPI0039BFB2B2